MPPRKSILILSDMLDDIHAHAVRETLLARGEEVVCLDPRELVSGQVTIAHERHDGNLSFSVACGGLLLTTDTVKSVLYRRPGTLQVSSALDDDYKAIVKEEWSALIHGLWELLPDAQCLWLSRPSAIKRAESKIWQLRSAVEFGLRVPATLITNDIGRARDFARRLGRPIVMKKLRTHSISVGTHNALFVTRQVDPETLDGESLGYCPIIFQELIPKTVDVRIVLIQRRAYAVRIFSQAIPETVVDYRAGKELTQSLHHELYSPPQDIIDSCQRMLDRFGLAFGAFDFLVDSVGNHCFLELNPNGQWLWLEMAARAPILGGICDALQQGCGL
jgi:glutathione synthase/RimK-type ligase-like ATP-grasp enzyme